MDFKNTYVQFTLLYLCGQLTPASVLALAEIGGKTKTALVDMAVLHCKTKPGGVGSCGCKRDDGFF